MSTPIVRSVAWLVAVLALLAVGWHLLGRVEIPTQASADVPSRPTVLPVNEADQALQEGRQWAITHGVTQHQECRRAWGVGLRAHGCHNQVTAQKVIPALENDGLRQPRTRDCVAAVHAHYDPLLQDMVERGDHHAASVWQRKTVAPLVEQCNNIDNVRFLSAVYEPLARLDALLNRLRAGQALAADDLAMLRREIPEVELYRDHPQRTRYLASAQELYALVGGRESVFPLAQSGSAQDAQCQDLEQQVVALKQAFHQSLESAASKVQVGEQDRLLAQWTQAQDARHRAGCPQLR